MPASVLTAQMMVRIQKIQRQSSRWQMTPPSNGPMVGLWSFVSEILSHGRGNSPKQWSQ